MKKVIMVSNLFNENNGSYATYGKNIVHETINYFVADDGYIYIYIPPRGTIGAKYIKDSKNLSLILTTGYGYNTLKVLYYVEDLEYIKENGTDIKYGEKTLESIFSTNITKAGEKDPYKNHVTFRTKNVKVPKNETILLTNHKDEIAEGTYYFEKN